jgi:hypothetical protein
LLRLDGSDGLNPPEPRRDLHELTAEAVTAYVGGLSTRARLDQFALPEEGGPVQERKQEVSAGCTRVYVPFSCLFSYELFSSVLTINQRTVQQTRYCYAMHI